MQVVFKLLDGCLPKRQTDGSAGYDLFSASEVIVPSGGVALVRLGFCMQIEPGFEAQIRSRSGLALKKMVFVLNSPGTIDSDYREEVGVVLMNLSPSVFHVSIGDRVAQMVFASVVSADFSLQGCLSSTSRFGGFGSTGGC